MPQTDPTLSQLEMSLRKADAAGDVSASKALAAELKARRIADTPTSAKVLGFPPTRFLLGSAAPILGVLQAYEHMLGKGEAFDADLRNLESQKQAGMQYWAERSGLPIGPGTDWMSIAGTTAATAPLTKFGPTGATTALGLIGRGMLTGGALGLLMPTEGGEDYATQKAQQAAGGAIVGGAVPAVLEAVKPVGTVASELWNLIAPSGAGKILTDYQRKLIGEQNLPDVVKKLRAAQEIVKGSKPTAAEAVSDLPAGSPIQAHQKVIAKLPGGPSAAFGERLAAKEAARVAAWEATDVLTTPMREAALSAANAKGGVSTPALLATLYDVANAPGIKGSSLAHATLDKVRSKISELAGQSLRVNAEDLYTIRKELGTYIAGASKDTANWDKKVAGGLLRDIQRAIDDAIEQSGGVGWTKYLETFSRQAKLIEQDALREKSMYKSIQPTTITASPISEEAMAGLPHLLSRPLVVANYLLGLIKGDIQPTIQAEAARRYLDPHALATALERKPKILDADVWNELVRLSGIAGATTYSTQPITITPREGNEWNRSTLTNLNVVPNAPARQQSTSPSP